jgi:hypothetical protein
MIVGQAVKFVVEAVDHLLDWVKAMKVNKLAKHLPARMRPALAPRIDHRKCFFKKSIVHDPFSERRVGVVIEVHRRAVYGKPKACRCLAPREAER